MDREILDLKRKDEEGLGCSLKIKRRIPKKLVFTQNLKIWVWIFGKNLSRDFFG